MNLPSESSSGFSLSGKKISPLIEVLPSSSRLLIEKHLSLLLEANKTINLTRITSLKDAKLLHVEDSLSALPEIEQAPAGLYGDLGSGGGFPGIPLAVTTGRKTILVESVQKKAHVLDQIIEKLGLSEQIETFSGRIEELALQKPGSFSVLTARALSSLPSLLELASPLLDMNALLICFKAQLNEEEFDQARFLEEKFGMILCSDRMLILSDKETKRRILVFKKVAKPTIKLPRRNGMAQRHPFLT